MPEYEIRVRGRLDSSWWAWFGDVAVRPAGNGETILRRAAYRPGRSSEDAVLGWNFNPTPFEWDGKRRARRIRAKQRRLFRLQAATTPQLIAA